MDFLLAILREALWGERLLADIPAPAIPSLLKEAEAQTVLALVADVLMARNAKMKSGLVYEMVASVSAIEQSNIRLNAELANFARLMADNHIDYFVVKGQTLAALYPKPTLRMPGDIDFLVKDYGRAAKVLHDKWNVELPPKAILKEVAFLHDDVLYELHTYLIDFGCKRHKRNWEQMIAETHVSSIDINGESICVLEPNLYVAYVFAHLFFHFIHEGIGMRHLCDMAIVLHHYRGEVAKERLQEILDNIGLAKAFRAFGSILVDKLGLTSFPFVLTESDRIFQKRIMSDIFSGGNFGKERRSVKVFGMGYKLETLWLTTRQCAKYLPLAPKELLMQIPRRLLMNVRLLTQK